MAQPTTEEMIRWLVEIGLDDETIVWLMEEQI
jgi:hypothetical protein